VNNLANIVGYQLVWCASVYGAAHGTWWAGLAVLAPFAWWQLRASGSRAADVRLAVCAAILGYSVDTLFAGSGLLAYASPLPSPRVAPAWILGIWIGFALTLNHSLRFLHDRPWLGLALGAVAGPAAYWIAASSWGAVRFAEPVATPLVALALAWGALTPALAWLSVRFERETGATPLPV
jgi:hypothetical protein